MTALSTLVDALKRELAVPGTFDDVFPDTGQSDLVGSLADGFAEAQLQGFFSDVALTSVAGPPVDWTTTPDLSVAGGAMVVIVTSIRFIRAQLRNLTTSERYKAGVVEMETQRAASVLRGELDYLTGRMDALIAQADKRARASAGMATVFDNYIARSGDIYAAGGFFAYEYRG